MPFVVLLFLVVPALEIYVLIQVGQVIGAVPTVTLLVLDAVLGAALFRSQGRRAWHALTTAIAEHRVPAREVADGALVVLGGAFLITPGFVTDLIGVLCLLPPTRALLRRALTGYVTRRMLLPLAPPPGKSGRPYYPGRASDRVVDGEVVDGEIVDDDGPRDRPSA